MIRNDYDKLFDDIFLCGMRLRIHLEKIEMRTGFIGWLAISGSI